MGDKPVQWRIDELGADHDRAGFSCGHPQLDDFIKKFASQNQRMGISRTFVATKPSDRVVGGYYSLSAGQIRLENLSEKQRKGLPKYPVPVAHLGKLAVDTKMRGQGLGEHLLLDAMARVVRMAREAGVHAIEVVAIDDAAKKFYTKYDFRELLDDPHHLYLPMKVVYQLGLD